MPMLRPPTTTFAPKTCAEFTSDKLNFNGIGVFGTALPGEVTNIDYVTTEDNLFQGVQLYTKGSVFGDFVHLQILDAANPYLAVPGYMLNQFSTHWLMRDDSQLQLNKELDYPGEGFGWDGRARGRHLSRYRFGAGVRQLQFSQGVDMTPDQLPPPGTLAVVQSWQRHVTMYLLFFFVAVFIGWDVYVAWNTPHSDTISEVTLTWFWLHPSLPAGIGYLMELTWPRNSNKLSKVVRAVLLAVLATVVLVLDYVLHLFPTMPPIIPFAVCVPLGHLLWPQVLEV